MVPKPYDANRAGSYTKAGWEPKQCCVCGETVVAQNGLFVYNLGRDPYSVHHVCVGDLRYVAVEKRA